MHPEPDYLHSDAYAADRADRRTESAIWPIQRWIPVLSHVHLTALLVTNENADLYIKTRRQDSLTSAMPGASCGAGVGLAPGRLEGAGAQRWLGRWAWPGWGECVCACGGVSLSPAACAGVRLVSPR